MHKRKNYRNTDLNFVSGVSAEPLWVSLDEVVGFSYLQIWHNFAKGVSKEPSLCNVHHKTCRQADDGDQDISNREIHYEIVGHGAHVPVFPHCKTNWEMTKLNTS